MIVATSWTMSAVVPSCFTSPSSVVRDREVGGVEVGLDPRAERAERVEALGPRPLAVGALQVARRDVVGDGVAVDALGGVLGLDTLGDRPMTTASSPS